MIIRSLFLPSESNGYLYSAKYRWNLIAKSIALCMSVIFIGLVRMKWQDRSLYLIGYNHLLLFVLLRADTFLSDFLIGFSPIRYFGQCSISVIVFSRELTRIPSLRNACPLYSDCPGKFPSYEITKKHFHVLHRHTRRNAMRDISKGEEVGARDAVALQFIQLL